MTELSKHHYLQVYARRSCYEQHNIRLPKNWDDMTDCDREAYVKQTCFARWQESKDDSSEFYNIGKEEYRWWYQAKPDDLDDWCVESTSLSELITQPKALLILKGLYAQNADAYWNEDDEDE